MSLNILGVETFLVTIMGGYGGDTAEGEKEYSSIRALGLMRWYRNPLLADYLHGHYRLLQGGRCHGCDIKQG